MVWYVCMYVCMYVEYLHIVSAISLNLQRWTSCPWTPRRLASAGLQILVPCGAVFSVPKQRHWNLILVDSGFIDVRMPSLVFWNEFCHNSSYSSWLKYVETLVLHQMSLRIATKKTSGEHPFPFKNCHVGGDKPNVQADPNIISSPFVISYPIYLLWYSYPQVESSSVTIPTIVGLRKELPCCVG